MVGRNDPCICGSGKKYKKCCGKSNVVDLSSVVDEELDRIMNCFVNDGMGPREYGVMDLRLLRWNSELRDVFDPELIEALAIDTYLYMERVDLWKGYLKKSMNKQLRSQVVDVLTAWEHPFYLLGQVQDQKAGQLLVRDELRETTYVMGGPEDVNDSRVGE